MTYTEEAKLIGRLVRGLVSRREAAKRRGETLDYFDALTYLREQRSVALAMAAKLADVNQHAEMDCIA